MNILVINTPPYGYYELLWKLTACNHRVFYAGHIGAVIECLYHKNIQLVIIWANKKDDPVRHLNIVRNIKKTLFVIGCVLNSSAEFFRSSFTMALSMTITSEDLIKEIKKLNLG